MKRLYGKESRLSFFGEKSIVVVGDSPTEVVTERAKVTVEISMLAEGTDFRHIINIWCIL